MMPLHWKASVCTSDFLISTVFLDFLNSTVYAGPCQEERLSLSQHQARRVVSKILLKSIRASSFQTWHKGKAIRMQGKEKEIVTFQTSSPSICSVERGLRVPRTGGRAKNRYTSCRAYLYGQSLYIRFHTPFTQLSLQLYIQTWESCMIGSRFGRTRFGRIGIELLSLSRNKIYW